LSIQPLRSKKIVRLFKRRFSKISLIKLSLITGNLILFLIILSFVTASTGNVSDTQQVVNSFANTNTVDPLDQLASASIALTVARMTNLPEQTAVTNQSDSEDALLSVAPDNNSVIYKPQIVATDYVSNQDIKTYVVRQGDTIASIAQKFNISTNSIYWSNNITGNSVTPGVKLLIPPVSGIVYTVKAGDTPASLASKFQANESLIIAYNDAEINGIYPGERIIIPNGTEPSAVANVSATYGWGSQATYGYNGYDPGNCTWWVAKLRAAAGDPLPTDLGNASTWGILAAQYGLPVGTTPAVGAAVVMSTVGEGHVAYVTAVHPNGTITISEMDYNYELFYVDSRTIPGAGYTYIY